MKKNKTAFSILLATDGSIYSKAATEEVARMSFPHNTVVRIIYIYEKARLISSMGPMGVMEEYYYETDRDSVKVGEHAIANASKILLKQNQELTITSAVIEGIPKSAILDEAEKIEADLIIVGSHGYGAIKRFLLGSVSQAVALHAKCSVLIVRK